MRKIAAAAGAAAAARLTVAAKVTSSAHAIVSTYRGHRGWGWRSAVVHHASGPVCLSLCFGDEPDELRHGGVRPDPRRRWRCRPRGSRSSRAPRVGDAHPRPVRRRGAAMWNDPAMPIPDFQTLMRPLLERVAAGGERRIAEVRAE